MSILSFEFLVFVFILILLYYILPLKLRVYVPAAAGVVFVWFAGWYSLAHLAAVSMVTWLGGLVLFKLKDKKLWLRRVALGVLLALDLGAMGFIKYVPVFTGWNLVAPLGLSYFTFQSAGLLIEIYRGKAPAQRNPVRVWLFTGYFLQLSQGPVSTWKDLGTQLNEGHRFDPDTFVSGFQLMLWGYFKKLVLADRLAATTQALTADGADLRGWFVLGGVILYALRLYADFSGGMDVVRGISRMFGIELPLNFKRPFFATSVADYWRRWHITLGTWFRSYLMYPLVTSKAGIGLGRACSKLMGKKTGNTIPTALATFIVFLLIGVWHGASWSAVIYGAYFGVIMAASMLLDPFWKLINRTLNLPKKSWMTPVRIVRTWLLILPAQYFAFTSGALIGFDLIKQTFGNWSFADFATLTGSVMSGLEWIIAGSAAFIVLIIDILCEHKLDVCGKLAKGSLLIRWPVLILLILAILVFGVYGYGFDSSAFLYTGF